MYKKLKQFKQDLRVIEKYYRYLVKLTKDHQVIGAFNEWILDNYASILEHENMVLEYYGDEKLMLSSKESGDIIWKCLSNYLEGSHFKMSKRNLIRCFLQYQKNNKIFFTYRELLLIRPILSMIAMIVAFIFTLLSLTFIFKKFNNKHYRYFAIYLVFIGVFTIFIDI